MKEGLLYYERYAEVNDGSYVKGVIDPTHIARAEKSERVLNSFCSSSVKVRWKDGAEQTFSGGIGQAIIDHFGLDKERK